MRLVAPGMIAFWRDHAGEHGPLRLKGRAAIGRLHERHEPADEYGDRRVDQGDREAGDEHQHVPALRLAREVPVEGEQTRWRLARPRACGPADSRLKVAEHCVALLLRERHSIGSAAVRLA